MAGYKTMKLDFTTLLFLSLVLGSFLLQATMAQDTDTSSPCDSKCGEGCAGAGMQDRCLKYCGLCCEKCKCVPSGTVGNKSECPCYRDMLNSKGTSKCP